MRKLANLTVLTFAFLVVVSGCQKSTVEGPNNKKLTLVKPADQTINRGDTNQVMITVARSNFRDPVDIRFDNLPKGVAVQDRDKRIGSDDNVTNFTLKAEGNADVVANHEVRVTVSGPDGMKATESFRLTVQDKK